MTARLLVLLLAVGLAAVPAGCRRNCVPEHLARSRNLIDLSLPPDAHAPAERSQVREVAAEFARRGGDVHPPGSRPYHFLALSGGGLYAPFGVGVLAGWSEAGTRPEFDVVTGISTGALMSTFAFLGPQYDNVLRESFVGVQRRDILRSRSLLTVPFAAAFYNARPLARRIEDALTPELLCEVAKAHAAGRRLYVGTTNLDSRRLVIWDMGAIASRGTPESRELYIKVVLASSSIPGAFPAIRLPVEIDGRRYEELHVDGGVSDEVIFRPFMVGDLNRMHGVPGHRAPPGSVVYVISNGKLYADPECVEPRLVPLLSASFRSIIYGKTRDELHRIYLVCMETGTEFRLTAVPQDLRLSPGSLQVSRQDQEQLYSTGQRIGRVTPSGEGWRDDPPGIETSEQALPRAGTRFVTGTRGP